MEQPVDFQPFKFKDLLFHASKEWLAFDKKKYRTVFDCSEINYLFVELSFYNKLIDQKSWDLHCQIKAYNEFQDLVCTIETKRPIPHYETIVFVREGWGMETYNTFWKKGSYRWELWMNGQYICEKSIHILDHGLPTANTNPYFNITLIRLYETESDLPVNKRVYYSTFDRSSTRYIIAEFNAQYHWDKPDPGYCELFFNFYTSSGALKGQIVELITLTPGGGTFTCTPGWGAEEAGTWYNDTYRLEVVFMDTLIAIYPFVVGDSFEESDGYEVFLPTKYTVGGRELIPDDNDDTPLESLLAQLDELIGLGEIKQQIRDYATYLQFVKLRTEKGIIETLPLNLHSVFLGNPGTGKTTVAKMLGKIYRRLGFLSKGTVLKVDRADIIGEYIGQTAPKVKEVVKKAKGGVLFIDEAYSLARKNDDSKDFGKEALEILINEMSDGDGDLIVIVAGYPDEMRHFMESNPGLKSRFNHTFDFPDYTPKELLEIAHFLSNKLAIALETNTQNYLYHKLVEAYRKRDKTFGNARYVLSLLEKAKINMGIRIMSGENPGALSIEELKALEKFDIEKIFNPLAKKSLELPIDEELLESALAELNSLIGLQKVKEEISDLITLSRFYITQGKEVREQFSLHSVFSGNPGTGKTTVARILANVFKSLSILERGHLVECDRQNLVAGYLGQTAEKTNQVVDSAIGGMLFIDEAYTLIHNEYDSYGKESVATLLKRMEDQRGQLALVVAGYPEFMNTFLQSNPGLKSRFDRNFYFEDYTAAELFEICIAIFNKNNTLPDEQASAFLQDFFKQISLRRDKFFGNARAARKTTEIALRNQHLRLAKVEFPSPDQLSLILLADVQNIQPTDVTEKKIGIGLVK